MVEVFYSHKLNEPTYIELRVDGSPIASIWGEVTSAQPEKYGDGEKIFVCINGTESFLHGVDKYTERIQL